MFVLRDLVLALHAPDVRPGLDLPLRQPDTEHRRNASCIVRSLQVHHEDRNSGFAGPSLHVERMRLLEQGGKLKEKHSPCRDI